MERNLGRAADRELTRHEAAADWLQRLDDPQLAEEHMQAWLEWFGASDANRKAFEELQTLRRRLRELPKEDLQELKRRTSIDSLSGRFGARELRERLELAPQNEPVPARSILDRWSRRRTEHARRSRYFAAAAGVCAIALGLGVWWKIQTHVSTATFAAPADHHRTVTLDDGSSVVLGAGAVIDVSYSAELRGVNIQRGQAYFEVRHNPERRFVVQAAGVRVTAVGTAFNVQRDTDKVTVTVTEGRVAVSDEARDLSQGDENEEREPRLLAESAGKVESGTAQQKEKTLAVGQRAVLPLAASGFNAPEVATGSARGWKNGRADFIDAPLREVLPVVNRYAPKKLAIDDPRVGDLTYSGTILRNHIDEWIASLPQVYAIRAVTLEDGTVTLVSRSATTTP